MLSGESKRSGRDKEEGPRGCASEEASGQRELQASDSGGEVPSVREELPCAAILTLGARSPRRQELHPALPLHWVHAPPPHGPTR